MPRVEIIKQKGYNFLWIDDYLWMWDIPVERRAQKKLADQAYGNVLVAGYGLGIVQRYLANNKKVDSVITVEILSEVIEKAKEEYGKIYGEIIIGNFYEQDFSQKFDCIIGDVVEDVEEETLAEYNKFETHAKQFLKSEGRILAWGQEYFKGLNRSLIRAN